MKWTVLETLVSPETGMAFSLVVSDHKNKFILWHLYSARIKPENFLYIHAGIAWVYEGEQVSRIQIYRANFYCSSLWESLKKHAGCEKYLTEDQCTFKKFCVISPCPRHFR